MLSIIFPLPLLTCIAFSTVADTFGAANLPTKGLDLPLLMNLQSYNTTPTSNSSNISTWPTPLPYGFSVPNTQTYLRLGFGLPRHRLDPMSMGGLIAVIQHAIVEGIEEDGEEHLPNIDPLSGLQRFDWTLGDGFYFQIMNILGTGRYFTWGQMKDVVEGLRLYLMIGKKYYATAFSFWVGPGWWRRLPLGAGGLWVDRDRKEEIANQKG